MKVKRFSKSEFIKDAIRGKRHIGNGSLDDVESLIKNMRASRKASKSEVQELRNISKNQKKINKDTGKMTYISSTDNGNSTTAIHTPRDYEYKKFRNRKNKGIKSSKTVTKEVKKNPNQSVSPIRSEDEFIKEKVAEKSYRLQRTRVRASGEVEVIDNKNLSMFRPGEMSNKG